MTFLFNDAKDGIMMFGRGSQAGSRFASLALILLAILTCNFANGADAVVGINFTHPLQLSVAEQNASIAAFKSAGVRVLRIGLYATDVDKGVDFIHRAFAQNVKVLLTVHSQYSPNAPVRDYRPQEFPGMWEGTPLSYADPELSGKFFQSLMDKLDATGTVLAGLELENEINHPAFNAEFPLPGEGKNFTFDDLNNDPGGKQIAKGYLQYLKVLATLKRIRESSKLNQRTALISAGLSDTGPEGPWSKKYDSAGISATIAFLRANGIDKLVDGYGIHTYPWADNPGDKAAAIHRMRRMQQDDLSECNTAGSKPCWVTEWGFKNNSTACPSDEKARSMLVQEMMEDFGELAREGRVLAIMFYTWSGDRVWDVYRCGDLTETGREAVQPL